MFPIVKLNLKKAANESNSNVIAEITSKGQNLTVTTQHNSGAINNPSNRLSLDASPVTMMKSVIEDEQPPKTVL